MTQGIRTSANQETAPLKNAETRNKNTKNIEDFDFTKIFSYAIGNSRINQEKNSIENHMIEKEKKTSEKDDKKDQEQNQQNLAQNHTTIINNQIYQQKIEQKERINIPNEPSQKSNDIDNYSTQPRKITNEKEKDQQKKETMSNNSTEEHSKQNKEVTNNNDKTQYKNNTNITLKETNNLPDNMIPNNQETTRNPITEEKQRYFFEQSQTIIENSHIEQNQAESEIEFRPQTIDKASHMLMQQAIAKGQDIQIKHGKITTTNEIGEIKQSTSNFSINLGQPNINGAQTIQMKNSVSAPGFVRELSHHLQTNINKNSTVINLKISPDSFGTINMRIVQRGSELQLVIRTKDEKTADALQQSINGLKENLAQSGINLSQIQVTGNVQISQNNNHNQQPFSHSNFTQNHQNQSNSNQGEQHFQQQKDNKNQRTEPEKTDSTNTKGLNIGQGPSGGVDVFA